MTVDRRAFLRSAAVAGAVTLAWPSLGLKTAEEARAQAALLGVTFDAGLFTLGVASGDPTATSVILWTRLAPEPLADDGGMPASAGTVTVDWVVATDPRLRRVVARGTAPAPAELAHSVHVQVDGLDPGTTYWYRFSAGSRVSRVGRTRTAPAPGSLDPVRFAFVSCAKFHLGYFTAYRRMCQEDLDLVVCLGDYIYEEVADPGEFRAEPDDEIVVLADYRRRYALYRGDPDLRAVHALFPWVMTWDDHEVDNNYAGLIPQDRDPAQRNDTIEAFAGRRADAYAANYEHFPYRTGGGDEAAVLPDGADFRIYRRLSYGSLVDFSVIDTRQYRTDQPCNDATLTANCSGVDDPVATILGGTQREWLYRQLDRDVAWRCVANQVMIGQLKGGGLPDEVGRPIAEAGLLPTTDGNYLNADQWDGYQADRRAVLGHIAEEEIPDVVWITGDIHTHWVHDLKVDFDDPTDPTVSTEFVGTSVTSDGLPRGSNPAVRAALLPTNPHVRYYEGERRGYAVCEVTPERWRTTFRTVADITDRSSPVSTLAAFEVARGTPGAVQVEGSPVPPPS
jgi:alkaline phosphatase D